jgi:hypothetical protein
MSDGGTPQWERILAGYAACSNAGLTAKLNSYGEEMLSLVYQVKPTCVTVEREMGLVIERTYASSKVTTEMRAILTDP